MFLSVWVGRSVGRQHFLCVAHRAQGQVRVEKKTPAKKASKKNCELFPLVLVVLDPHFLYTLYKSNFESF